MTWLFVVLAIVVLACVVLAAVGFLGELPPSEPDLRPDTRDGEPAFDVVVRGYRMDEVDEQIASLQAQLEQARHSGLEQAQRSGQPAADAGPDEVPQQGDIAR